MSTSKIIKRIALSILGIFLLLTVVLVVHIATAEPVVIDNATMQVSRIDFAEPLTEEEVKMVKRSIKSIEGVKTEKINAERGVLVFFHDNRVADAKKIHDQFKNRVEMESKLYVVSPDLANKKVCPVGDVNSFSFKFSRGIQRIFN
jgi:copper chaperone CopZ